MSWKLLALMTAVLGLVPASAAWAGKPAVVAGKSSRGAVPSTVDEAVEAEKERDAGTNLGRVLGEWTSSEGVTIRIATHSIGFTNRDGSQVAPMKVASQEGQGVTAQLLDDEGKDAERVRIEIVSSDAINMTWETGKKKGKKMDLVRVPPAPEKKP